MLFQHVIKDSKHCTGKNLKKNFTLFLLQCFRIKFIIINPYFFFLEFKNLQKVIYS